METISLSPAIKALCWTLIHSLWIGLLIALLVGVVLLFTRKAPAALRYQLLCGLLLLFLFGTGFIFYAEFTSVLPAISTTATATPGVINHFTPVATPMQVISGTIVLIDHYIAWLFFAWLFCLIIKGTKLIGGLLAIQQIRSGSNDNIPAEWHEKIKIYSEKLGIIRHVRLLQSVKITVPATVGFFKPVILLPVDVLLQLAPGQVESILWHELAHIARRDYLTGLLQEIIETIFFFNPALLWLSELIREEREKCCDDIVIAHTANKSAYLQVLLSFESSLAIKIAASLTNFRKSQFRNRMDRLIGRRTPLFSLPERLLLLTSLIFISGLLLMAKPTPKINIVPKATERLKQTFVKLQPIKVKTPKRHEANIQLPILSDQQRVRQVIDALIQEKVVPDVPTLDWFGLSDTELIVNGEKQPAALQEKLKVLVSVGPGNGLYFGPVKMTGQGVFIEKKEL